MFVSFRFVSRFCLRTKEEYRALHKRVPPPSGKEEGDDDDDSDADADDARRPSLEFVRGKRRAFISSGRSKTPLFLLSKSIRGRSDEHKNV